MEQNSIAANMPVTNNDTIIKDDGEDNRLLNLDIIEPHCFGDQLEKDSTNWPPGQSHPINSEVGDGKVYYSTEPDSSENDHEENKGEGYRCPRFQQIKATWEAESLEQYEPGGFHPIHLDDLYDEGRYKSDSQTRIWCLLHGMDGPGSSYQYLDQPEDHEGDKVFSCLRSWPAWPRSHLQRRSVVQLGLLCHA